jgi:hypothetical protein
MNRVKIRREFVDELWQVSWTFSHHSLNFWPGINLENTIISCRNMKHSFNLPSWETCVILSTRESKANAISSARPPSYLVTSLDDYLNHGGCGKCAEHGRSIRLRELKLNLELFRALRDCVNRLDRWGTSCMSSGTCMWGMSPDVSWNAARDCHQLKSIRKIYPLIVIRYRILFAWVQKLTDHESLLEL